MFFPEIEYKSAQEIKIFQEQLLIKMVNYVNHNSPYYRKLFLDNNINPSHIKTIEQLSQIPITEKHHLQELNEQFLCIDKSKIVDYITTSGTLGDPVTFAMSDADLDRLAYNEAISFACAGGHSGEIYQLMTTIDKRFMAGLAYFLGIRKLGAGIIRVGNGIPQLQWDTIQRIKPNAIICVPSFILKIIDYAQANGIDYQNSSIRKAVCIGESIREQDFSLNLLGQKIKSKWDIELYSTYASTEMATTFTECQAGQGGHHHPELIITELVDCNGDTVGDGQYGELVITTLGVEAMPLLRFRTGDIARMHTGKCSCGRTTQRISPIVGRINQMIKYKGTSLYPAAIFDVLDNLDYIENYYVEVTDSDCGTDALTVYISCSTPYTTTIKELKDNFRARLRVTPNIVIKDAGEIRQVHALDVNRKPTKFIDKRNSTKNELPKL